MLKSLIIVLLLISNIDASIRVCNNGAYLAKCYLESRSLSYGIQIRYDDTGLFPVAQCRSMEVPIDAVWNRLEYFASAMYSYCYQITGTTLSPRWSQTQC